MKKVIVDYTKSYDKGLVGWLHRIPSDKQYVDIVMIDAGKRCGKESKIVPAQRGRGFLITDELTHYSLNSKINSQIQIIQLWSN